jgi:hypothetical protein
MNPGLDTLYAKTLSRSQHLPHFPDVISMLVFLVEPLPIAGIAELLGIESFEVVQVLVNLEAIIHVPGTDDLPVTMCHTSLRDFLTTESRSGCFFTPPSYHLYLLYRCSTLHNRREPDTAAALYSIGNFANHIEQLVHLPPAARGPLPRFPQTLDSFYIHILARSQVHPHFSDIISTIVLHKPLPAARISELLGIETFKVIQVLSNLRPIFNIPETDDSPITMCHISVHQFLTIKSQSGHFYVPPSYHLKLSCYYFRLKLLNKSPLPPSQDALWSSQSNSHWKLFLEATSAPSIHVELDQLTHLPSQPWPYQHLFAFTLPFLWLFQVSHHKPPQIMSTLVKGVESLALALEQDDAPEHWLQWEFDKLVIISRLTTGIVGLVEINEKHIKLMQHYVQRIEAALRAKVLLHFAFGVFHLSDSEPLIQCSVLVGFQIKSIPGTRVLIIFVLIR